MKEVIPIRPAYYLGDHTTLTTLWYGPKIFLDTRDIVQLNILYHGFWEKWISDVFLDVLQPGMTMLDIGAHCGYYALLAAQKVGRTGHVHAIEPNADMIQNATKSQMINGYRHMHWHAVALSDHAGKGYLIVPESGGASLTDKASPELQQVETVILSEYMKELKVDVIKMDVDGSEPRILPCIFKLIERSDNPVVFMEYCPSQWRRNGYDPQTFLSEFIRLKYEFFVLEHNGSQTPISLSHLIAYDQEEHLDLFIKKP